MMRLLCLVLSCLLFCSALAETVQDQALAFIQEAGIGADSVMRVDNEVIVTLTEGGTASLYSYGDFDPYDLSWRFTGASDADAARYLDYALSLLAALEGRIPADTADLSAAEAMRARNYAVMVSNALLYLENTGEQGLRILLEQLSHHDDSGLNSLRARLASRLLGALDNSPVDPALGCAWYDALTLSVQDDLPLPDASVYTADAFLAQATQLIIARDEARRADYTWGMDVDPAKTTTLAVLLSPTVRLDGDRATVFACVASSKYALYDGVKLRELSGSVIPSRIELSLTEDGWQLASIIEAEDGESYAASILSFCEGDQALANSLMKAADRSGYEDALTAYLVFAGYPEASE